MSVNIVQGNALALPLADNSVQCAITSPPYWGLRDYGVAGQLGLEPVPDCLGWATGAPCGECFVCHMVQVFREVRRVLRPDGTCWLNLGDSYAGSTQGGSPRDYVDGGKKRLAEQVTDQGHLKTVIPSGLKPKDLIGIPWRVAFALQADGWYLRSDCIWSKPNPMPESVTDRPTKAHEYLFLLAKSSRYYYDAEAVKEEAVYGENRATFLGGTDRLAKANISTGGHVPSDKGEQRSSTNSRNRRTVWTIATQAYSGAHFATFPEKLVEPCLLAGTSARGACPHCGAPWARQIENGLTAHDGATASAYAEGTTANRLALLRQAARARGEEYTSAKKTLGWAATCACPPHEPRPCVVLDPFSGSGTVGRVAVKHRRRFVGVELNPGYIALAEQRTKQVQVEMAL